MAFNDKPYIKFKLDNKEYSKVNIDNKTVWRKPINYVRNLLITNSSGVTKSSDALIDGGLVSFSLLRKKTVSGAIQWETCLTPENNNTSEIEGGPTPIVLGNQKVLKYEDVLKFNYTLAQGYVLYPEDDSKIVYANGTEVNLNSNTEFTAYNDFNINVQVRPELYTVTINTDTHLNITPVRIYGRISEIQGDTGTGLIDGNKVYYGDKLSYVATAQEGYTVDNVSISGQYNEETGAYGNVVITATERPIKSAMYLTASGHPEGLVEGSVKMFRTAGSIAQELGYTDGYISNVEYIYTGDSISFEAQAKTGYEVTLPSNIDNVSESYLIDNPTINRSLNVGVIDYKFSIIHTGDISYPYEAGTSSITNVTIIRTPGEISESLGITEGEVYNGESKAIASSDTPVEYISSLHYGDTISAVFTLRSQYAINLIYGSTTLVNRNRIDNISISEDTVLEIWAWVKWAELIIGASLSQKFESVTVTRTASPLGNASLGPMESRDMIFQDDVIYVEATLKPGYATDMTIPYSETVQITSEYYSIRLDAYVVDYNFYIDKPKGISRFIVSILKDPSGEYEEVYNGTPLESSESYCTINCAYDVPRQKVKIQSVASTGFDPVPEQVITINESRDYHITITETPTPRSVFILDKTGLASVKITCLNPGISSHTIGQVLYNGELQADNYSYCTAYYNEVLKFEWASIEAYENLNDDTVTVLTSNITLTKSSSLKTYTLSIVKNTGVNTIVVKRTYRRYPEPSGTYETLSNGSIINYGDNISITSITASTGYTLDEYTRTYTNVTSNLTISPTAHTSRGFVYISKDNGVQSITVKRGNTNLSDGDVIYYGDTLTVSCIAKYGYSLNYPYNETFSETFYPEDDSEVLEYNATSYPSPYQLRVTIDSGIDSYTVERLESPIGHGSIGTISSGDPVYYQDKLSITYNAKDDYVVGDGYGTSGGDIFYCLKFSGNYFRYSLTSTELWIFRIDYQYAVSGNTLLRGDRIDFILNYPDDPDTPVAYDGTKKVRIDDSVRLYVNNQTFKQYLPSINKIIDFEGNQVALVDNNGNPYYDIPANNIYASAGVYFNASLLSFRIKALSDNINFVDPENAVVTLSCSSRYGTTASSTYSVNVSENNYSVINFYYRDTITITYTEITGWKFNNIEVYNGSTLVTTLSNGGSVTLADNYSSIINRNIKSWNYTAQNNYAKYTYIWMEHKVNGETVREVLEENWTSNGKEPRNLGLFEYGSRFQIKAGVPDWNAPMILYYRSHNNNTWYNVLNNDDPFITITYLPELVAPSQLAITGDYISLDRRQLHINFYNSNCQNTEEFTAHIEIYQASGDSSSEGSLIKSVDLVHDNMTTIDYSLQVYLNRQPGGVYLSTFTAKIYFYGKKIGSIDRTDSEVSTIRQVIGG